MVYILFLTSIVVGFLGWKLLPPSNLYKIPSVPLIPFLLSFINQEPNDKRSERLILPILYKHGITKFWLNRWVVVISDTVRAKEIFNKTNIYEKDTLRAGAEHTVGARLFGNNIVFTSGEEWKRHRKAANPAFHRSWSTELVGNCCEVLLDKIQLEKEPIEILPFLKRMTLDALGKAIFNFDFKAVEQPEGKYVKIYTSLMQEFRKIVYAFLPFLESPILNIRANAHARVTEFRALIGEVLEQKKKELQSGGEIDESKADLLTLMVKANMLIMEDGEPLLSNEEIINDTVIFFVAGHDTTANTLAFILYYLSKHQDIQQKAREEVIRVMGKRTGPPNLEEQKEMHYLLAIIYEAMRIKPTVAQLFRKVNTEVEIDQGIIMKPGQLVSINLYAMLHDPNYWKEPNEFKPDRFIKETLVNDQPSYEFDKSATKAWFAFGGGPRSCIGLAFSLMEQKILLSMLLTKFKFYLPKDSPYENDIIVNSAGLAHPKDLKLQFEEL